jgi:hypothetical protein
VNPRHGCDLQKGFLITSWRFKCNQPTSMLPVQQSRNRSVWLNRNQVPLHSCVGVNGSENKTIHRPSPPPVKGLGCRPESKMFESESFDSAAYGRRHRHHEVPHNRTNICVEAAYGRRHRQIDRTMRCHATEPTFASRIGMCRGTGHQALGFRMVGRCSRRASTYELLGRAPRQPLTSAKVKSVFLLDAPARRI